MVIRPSGTYINHYALNHWFWTFSGRQTTSFQCETSRTPSQT